MTRYKEAINKIQMLLSEAQRAKLVEPTAMTLATVSPQGRPSARVVLLKGVDERGFVFYTNFNSRKGRELKSNSSAALVFYWDPLDYQIRIEGQAQPVSNEEADEYWITRPRDSQIGAWASLQSEELDRKSSFLKRIASVAIKYAGRAIPRPPHWSGFRIIPSRIEFWKKKKFRLHERVVYEKQGTSWRVFKLYP